MSPLHKFYSTDNMEQRQTEHQLRKVRSPRPSDTTRVAADRRPIHRLRKGLPHRVVPEVLRESRTPARTDENVVFREGFHACATLLQTYVRTHQRMTNRVKDDLLITIHHYLQFVDNHSQNVPSVIHPTSNSPIISSGKLVIKQEPIDNDVGYVMGSSIHDVVMSDDKSVTSDVTSEMAASEAGDNDVGSPMFLRNPGVLSGVEERMATTSAGGVISCRHCTEEDGVESTQTGCCGGDDACCQGDHVNRCGSPVGEPQDLSLKKGQSLVHASSDEGATSDVWRPWGPAMTS